MWTQFLDMHSGGRTKEEPYEKIYIEAPRKEAEVIFYNRFGHSPNRVTCTCCGEDYSVDENQNLHQLTAFHRGCRWWHPPGTDVLTINKGRYFEKEEAIPEGWVASSLPKWHEYIPLEMYIQKEDVLVIYEKDIKPEERVGEVPTQGYVWMG